MNARNFIVGQLVATRFAEYAAKLQAGEDIGDDFVSIIGRVQEVNETAVTIKAANGTVETHDASILVDVVHYDSTKQFTGTVGGPAGLFAIDHPLLPANEWVTTSAIKFILADGKFETRNTLYIPSLTDVFGIGIPELMIPSPYLTGEA